MTSLLDLAPGIAGRLRIVEYYLEKLLVPRSVAARVEKGRASDRWQRYAAPANATSARA